MKLKFLAWYEPVLADLPRSSSSSGLQTKRGKIQYRGRDLDVVNDYTLLIKLGSGTYGSVYLALNAKDRQTYAMKVC